MTNQMTAEELYAAGMRLFEQGAPYANDMDVARTYFQAASARKTLDSQSEILRGLRESVVAPPPPAQYFPAVDSDGDRLYLDQSGTLRYVKSSYGGSSKWQQLFVRATS